MSPQNDLQNAILQLETPALITEENGALHISTQGQMSLSPTGAQAFLPAIGPGDLGDLTFKKRHGLVYPYVAGAMANGISSTALVNG